MSEKINLKNYTLNELEELLISLGEKKFRAKQIFSWIYKGVSDIDEMTNLSKSLRENLKKTSYIGSIKMVKKLVSKIDGTTKYLFMLEDGNIIESVLMSYKYGYSICISSQVGCRMGCTFCASGLEGLQRHMTCGEIIDQVLAVQVDIRERISNIVLMGTGEPLDNYTEVLKFLDIVNHPEGLGIGMRHITISTSGLAERIKDLADKNLQITLAISLHAPNDDIRQQTMPVAFMYSMEELLEACEYYIKKTNRRITFEYAMVKDVNDKPEHARELGKKLKGMLCHVNLIRLNEIDERDLKQSELETVEVFKDILNSYGVETTIRRKMGIDIQAACGQLRRSFIQEIK